MKFTTNHPSLGRIILGLGVLSLLSFVEADFAQCMPGWEWSYNSQGLNPCQIAGSLQAPCLGYSVYTLGPLAYGTNYLTPQKNDTLAKTCGCNTIIYTLYAACTACQFNSSYTPLTWAFWAQFCDNVYVTQYPLPVPFNASVPHWAYLNDTGPSFNAVLAQAAGRDPEATPTSPPTVGISSTPSSQGTNLGVSTLSTKTSPDPASTNTAGGDGSDNNTTNKSHTGAIAGGVVGGVIGLGLIAALAFFLIKRRRESESPSNILGPSQMGYTPTGERVYETPKLYDPADPSTFPTPPSGGDSSNSGGYTTNPYQAGRYNGAAEL